MQDRTVDLTACQCVPMKFGIALGQLNPAFFVEATVEGERLGYESVWLPEHLVLPVQMAGSPFAGEEHPPVPPSTPVFDAVAYLSFLAGRTSTIRLGTWVYLLGLRHPFVGARAFATLDIVSGGRAAVGLGAGWLDTEWDAVGLDFRSRGRRLDEAISVCRRLWEEEVVEHHGEFFDFGPVMFEPKPVQRPLPLLIGGGGEKVTMRIAARYADEWNAVFMPPERFAELDARLDELLQEVGRSPEQVRRTLMTRVVLGRTAADIEHKLAGQPADELKTRGVIVGTAPEVVEQLACLDEAGVQRVMLQWLETDDLDGLEAMAQSVLPRL